MSVFGKDFDDAKPGVPGVYIEPGDYVLDLVKCKMIKNRKKEIHFAAELEVVESTVDKSKPGSIVTYCVPLRFDGAMGDIKSFLAACLDESPEKLKASHADGAVSDANPLGREAMKAKGKPAIRLNCNAWAKPTKTGGLFTKTRWSKAPAVTEKAA